MLKHVRSETYNLRERNGIHTINSIAVSSIVYSVEVVEYQRSLVQY